MTKIKTKKVDQIARLQHKVKELEAQLASNYHFASLRIPSANRAKTLGSGVLVQLHYLGGREVCDPFVLRDGLSDELIAALQSDIRYSHELATMLKPKED